MARNRQPWFVPDFGDNWQWSVALAVRISRLGKCIQPKFASRYYDARTLLSMSQSVLTEFEAFVQSGSQYREDAVYIRHAMDEFHEQTERLKHSMSDIADSISTITKAIDDGAGGIAGVAGNTKNLALDMEDITQRMGVNQKIVEGLKKETVVFDNL